MSISEKLYDLIAAVVKAGVMAILSVSMVFLLIQVVYLPFSSLGYQIYVFNEAWKSNLRIACERKIAGCIKLVTTEQYITTDPAGPSWQWVGSRQEVTFTAKAGFETLVRESLLQEVGRLQSSHIIFTHSATSGAAK